MVKKSILITLSFIFSHFSVSAKPFDTTISIEVGSDEIDNTSSTISVDMELNNDKHVFFGIGKSKTPTGSLNIENNLAFLGLSKKFTDAWKLTGTLEYSGLKDAFTMFSTSAAIRYSSEIFFLELIPGLRSINLTTVTNRRINISSSALGVKTGVYIGNHFRLSGSAHSYNYSHDLSGLASFASSRFFNVKTLLLSSGLYDETYNAETGVDFDSFSISVGKNRSISAIDQRKSDYVYSVFDYYISHAWGLSLLLGKYLEVPSDENNFSSLTVNYSF